MEADRDLLASKLRGAGEQLRHLPRAVRLVWEAARGWTAAWAGLLALQGLLPVAIVYLTREVVDSLVAAIASKGAAAELTQLALGAGAMGAVLLAIEALRGACEWVGEVQARLVQDHMSALVQRKSAAVDLAFYESPEYHDHLHRARAEAGYRPLALLENCGRMIQHGITLIAMAAVLLPYGIWIPLALLVSTAPAFVVVVRFALKQHRWRTRTTADERRTGYYDWLVTSAEAAAELRLFGLGAHFQDAYARLRARLRGEELAIVRQRAFAELAAGTIGLAVSAACIAWVAWRAIEGRSTLGDLALFYQAFSQGQLLMRSLLAAVGQVYYNVLFIGNLFAFLDLEHGVKSPPQPRAWPAPGRSGLGIRFLDVTFRYPGSDRVALRNLELAIPAGQVAAIVGANGAGKSTLVKLLCRFYDPQAGRIEIDGRDVRDAGVEDLRSLITVLFQQPLRYNATVAENIAPGRAGEHDALAAAARAAGALDLIERLPQGSETLLGKWFEGGVELSAGEWQRLALARAVMRPAPIILLDEPTSAMDSWAEIDWMRRFRELAAGRTALIVTHRFTTAMQADVIYVMSEGRVAEHGSHAELLRRGGAYAGSWKAQMMAGHGAAGS